MSSRFSSPFMAKSPLRKDKVKKEEVESKMSEGTSASVYERRKPGKKGRAVAVVENTEDDGSKTYEKVTAKVDKEGYVEGKRKRKNISKKRAERIKRRKNRRAKNK